VNIQEFHRQLPALQTERLLLRKLAFEDAGDYFAFASDPQVTCYLRWGPHGSLAETQAYLTEVVDGYRKGLGGPWGIEMVQERRLIGAIHLMDVDPVHLKAEVGVLLNAQYWRKGIGSEALRCVVDFCFNGLGLHRLQGLAVTGNTSACRMMEKCSMTHEGVLRSYALQKGEWRDFDVYSVLSSEQP
jgi:[ribosomal protein S5]-alanine N-acetyltransferase